MTTTVYVFVWHYYQAHGFGPTQQEIGDACFLSQSSVSRHMDKLTLWGWISREEGKARGLRPIKPLPEGVEEDELEKSNRIIE